MTRSRWSSDRGDLAITGGYRSACASDRSGQRSFNPQASRHHLCGTSQRGCRPDESGKGTVVTQQNVTVAVTGAGGTGVAKALLTALQRDDRVGHVDLLVSANGRKLVAFEFRTGEDPDSVVQALEATSPKVRFLDPADMSGPVTSGSYPSDAMIILPCAAGVLGRIAHGQTESLIERAADVMLKQRRRLVLCLREAPLNLIH